MEKLKFKGNWIDMSFHLTLFIKSLAALGEVIGGIALLIVPVKLLTGFLSRGIGLLPKGHLALLLTQANNHLTRSATLFVAIYLLAHGLLKVMTLALLWKKVLWSYPLSVLLFCGFIGYQLADFIKKGNMSMLLLTALDLIMIVLTLLEYQKMRTQRQWTRPIWFTKYRLQKFDKCIIKKISERSIKMRKLFKKIAKHNTIVFVIVDLAALFLVFVSAQYFL